MILTDLKAYLSGRGRATLSDMALHFDSDPDALRGMLEQFIRKGRVRRLTLGPACGGCQKCDLAAPEIYEWTEGRPAPRPDSETTPVCPSMPGMR